MEVPRRGCTTRGEGHPHYPTEIEVIEGRWNLGRRKTSVDAEARMGVRFWLANGLVFGGMAWMMTFAGMEVRAAQVLPRQVVAGGAQLDQLETRAALTPASSPTVAALAG